MSNSLAIAAVTTTLRNVLLDGISKRDSDLADLDVTTRTPDVARQNVTGTSLNVFLYRTSVNTGWSNLEMPRVSRQGEAGHPPLSLDLHYLITAYGRDASDQNALSHRILGGAMSVLHDHPVLGAAEIRQALTGNDLADQCERIRIAPQPLSVDDMSKLWSTFQSHYRLSAAYVVTVVLVDSLRDPRAALPVLTRGKDDRGVVAVAGAGPSLTGFAASHGQPAARLGEDLVLIGGNLGAPGVSLHFAHTSPGLHLDVELPVAPTGPGEPSDRVTVRLAAQTADPDALRRWAPGFYTVAAAFTSSELPTLMSNSISFALSPRIMVAPNSSGPNPVPPGATLTVTCSPRARKRQRVQLVFGDRMLDPVTFVNPSPASPDFAHTPTTLTFEVPSVPAKLYPVRLRVDGVDSLPLTFTGDDGRPEFDPKQQVSVA